jgi:murein DD-endopeptidase MepM/ murein hydrolase activator NlpD
MRWVSGWAAGSSILLTAATLAGQGALPFRRPIKGSLPLSRFPSDQGTEFDSAKAATWYSVVWTGKYCGAAKDRGEGTGGHPGVDIRAWYATSKKSKEEETDLGVYAVGDGTLRMAANKGGWGNIVVVEHHGVVGYGTVYSVYAHLEEDEHFRQLQSKDPCLTLVSAADRLGTMGTSGGVPLHLHFQVDRDWPAKKQTPYWPVVETKPYPENDCGTLENLRQYLSGVQRNTADPMALVDRGRYGPPLIVGEPTTGTAMKEAFVKAFKQAGAVTSLGCASGPVLPGFTSFAGSAGYYQELQGGLLEFHSGQAYAVLPTLSEKWKKMGFTSGNPLGYPTSDLSPQSAASTGTKYRLQQFEGGALVWHLTGAKKDSVFEVHGAIYKKWASLNNASWSGGLPVADEAAVGLGSSRSRSRMSKFEKGEIWWKEGNPEAFATQPPISDVHLRLRGGAGSLGFPTSDVVRGADGSLRQHFEGGDVEVPPGGAPQVHPSCEYFLTNESVEVKAGGALLLQVRAQVRARAPKLCPFEAKADVPWIHLFLVTHLGSIGRVQFSVDRNSSRSPRVGRLAIANKTVTVRQAAADSGK